MLALQRATLVAAVQHALAAVQIAHQKWHLSAYFVPVAHLLLACQNMAKALESSAIRWTTLPLHPNLLLSQLKRHEYS